MYSKNHVQGQVHLEWIDPQSFKRVKKSVYVNKVVSYISLGDTITAYIPMKFEGKCIKITKRGILKLQSSDGIIMSCLLSAPYVRKIEIEIR